MYLKIPVICFHIPCHISLKFTYSFANINLIYSYFYSDLFLLYFSLFAKATFQTLIFSIFFFQLYFNLMKMTE